MFKGTIKARLKRAEEEISRLKDENKRIIDALERGDGNNSITCARLIDEWVNGREGENER
ncbi:MAG: hypothetical protein IJV68_02045 [Clostridia bacterium]|nr:hypothetical protein [Clostridia bacterium]MBQ9703307.1 hypothetical protein [Clostridia bacterium]